MYDNKQLNSIQAIRKIAEKYVNLIYGHNGEGCDTCDYDLENAGFISTTAYGTQIGTPKILKFR